nr:DUF2306 domain-containing protein [uncultured Flavobacterium sp.]
MKHKISFILLGFFATIIGIVPFVYYSNNIDFGIIKFKESALLSNRIWTLGFHIHIVFAAIALSIGWLQFIKKFYIVRLNSHIMIGKIYIVSALISSFASICISITATGDMIAFIGFMLLGIIWLYTTSMGFVYIKSEEYEKHKKIMIYSYAACFSGVTLRIWIPILEFIFKDFITAYSIVAWLCWLPNLIVAYFIIQRTETELN